MYGCVPYGLNVLSQEEATIPDLFVKSTWYNRILPGLPGQTYVRSIVSTIYRRSVVSTRLEA